MESVKIVGGLSISSAPLDFLLELPAHKVPEMRVELLRLGIKERAIKVIDQMTAAKAETSRKQSHRVAVDSDNGKQRVFQRFLPSAIKLGTCGNGQFNVTFRRRATANDRETIWITLRKKTCSESANPLPKDQKVDEAIDDRQHCRRRRTQPPPPTSACDESTTNDDNGDERSATGRPCRCATAMECYRNVQALSEYLYGENGSYSDFNVCIFKYALDALKVYSIETSGEDIIDAIHVSTTTVVKPSPSFLADDKRPSSRTTVQNDEYPTATESMATCSLEPNNQSSSPDFNISDLLNSSVMNLQLCDGDKVTYSGDDSTAVKVQKEVDMHITSPILAPIDSSKCTSLTLKSSITETTTNDVVNKNMCSNIQKSSPINTKEVNQKPSKKKIFNLFKNKSNKILTDTSKKNNGEDTGLDGKVTIPPSIIAKKSKKGPLGDPFKR